MEEHTGVGLMDDQTIQQLMEGDYQPVGYSLTCPNCYGSRTLFLGSSLMWLCLDCGIEFEQEDTLLYYFIGEENDNIG